MIVTYREKKILFIFTLFFGFFLLNKVFHFPKFKDELKYIPPKKILLGEGWKSQHESVNRAFKAAIVTFIILIKLQRF